MNTALLATKLFIPAARAKRVVRPRLVELINRGIENNACLTLVCAPAGYGKSTLAADWLRSRLPADRIAWLSLDEQDNTPGLFVAYLTAALTQLDEDIGRSLSAIAAAAHLPEPALVMTGVINALVSANPHGKTKYILALDDYHHIKHAWVQEAVQFLIEHAPPMFHLLLITREDPPLPLSKLRIGCAMVEIRERDLRFNQAETDALFNQTMGLGLSEEWVQALEARTEGWAAGLQLAALSLQNRPGTAEFLKEFTGSNRYVIDYLMEEVLQRFPLEVRTFLLKTSILERFNAPLCEALTGVNNAGALLRKLEKANLFLIPLDAERHWYRYHHLFGDFLRTELDEAQQSELHRTAADWFQKAQLTHEAVRHALASGDFDFAADTIQRALQQPVTWSSGQVGLLESWLESLPQHCMRERPELAVRASRALYLAGKMPQAEGLLDLAEQALESSPTDDPGTAALGLQAGLFRAAGYAFQGQLGKASQILSRISKNEALLDSHTRARLEFTRALIHDLRGETEAALAAYLSSSEEAHLAGVQYLALNARSDAAMLQVQQGNLTAALTTCQQALDMLPVEDENIPPAGLVWAVKAEIAREQGDFDQAQIFMERAIDLSRSGGIVTDLGQEYLGLARLKASQGDPTTAGEVIRQAVQIFAPFSTGRLTDLCEAIQARMDLLAGRTAQALEWAQAIQRRRTSQKVEYLREYEELVLARILIATGQIDDARAILAEIERQAEKGGRARIRIECLLLTALSHAAAGQQKAALQALHTALQLGQPEGLITVFSDEGKALRSLLVEMRSRLSEEDLKTYIDRLLQPQNKPVALAAAPPAPDAPDSLSRSELSILILLARGLSNQEIADELVISVGTAKWHAHNIYAKLGVKSRTQAVSKAKALGLI